MLRGIKGDLDTKHYAARARQVAFHDPRLLLAVRRAVAKENKKAALGIRSISKSHSTAVLRATSKSAMSELYMLHDCILNSIKSSGATQIRFTV